MNVYMKGLEGTNTVITGAYLDLFDLHLVSICVKKIML